MSAFLYVRFRATFLSFCDWNWEAPTEIKAPGGAPGFEANLRRGKTVRIHRHVTHCDLKTLFLNKLTLWKTPRSPWKWRHRPPCVNAASNFVRFLFLNIITNSSYVRKLLRHLILVLCQTGDSCNPTCLMKTWQNTLQREDQHLVSFIDVLFFPGFWFLVFLQRYLVEQDPFGHNVVIFFGKNKIRC